MHPSAAYVGARRIKSWLRDSGAHGMREISSRAQWEFLLINVNTYESLFGEYSVKGVIEEFYKPNIQDLNLLKMPMHQTGKLSCMVFPEEYMLNAMHKCSWRS